MHAVATLMWKVSLVYGGSPHTYGYSTTIHIPWQYLAQQSASSSVYTVTYDRIAFYYSVHTYTPRKALALVVVLRSRYIRLCSLLHYFLVGYLVACMSFQCIS